MSVPFDRLRALASLLEVDGELPAASATYDPTASGMTATDVQAAIDELEAGGGGGLTHPQILARTLGA